MNSQQLLTTIPLSIGLAGGLLLLIAPFSPRNKAAASRNLRTALFLSGILCMAWAAMGLIDEHRHPGRTEETHSLLHHYKTLLVGAASGIMILALISGEFLAACRRGKELRRQRKTVD